MNPAARAITNNLLPVVRVVDEDDRRPIAERLAHYGCPGVGVAVIEGGELAWTEGFGVLEHGSERRVDASTMFSGASISKPLTAAMALQFVERGLFDLDTDVNRYLKSWRVPENEFTRQSPVTLRWLLCHKAGTTIHGFGGVSPQGHIPSAREILSSTVTTTSPQRTTHGVSVDKIPGGTTRYSGGGTTIVEVMLEDVSGKPFEMLANENIFEPLGMTRSTFEVPLPEKYRANAAVGHREGAVPLAEKFICAVSKGAASIFTTPSDYAHFMIACRDAWLGKPGPLFGPKIAAEMFTRQGVGEFGLGWELLGGKALRFGHGGSNDGYQCESTCYLESGQGAVVMTNAVSGLIFYWEIFNTIADHYRWPDFMPAPKRIRPISESDFHRYVGEYEIVRGIDAPEMKIWAEDGQLKSQIAGMRGGAKEIFMDQNGRFFNRQGPYETEIIYDSTGTASELVVLRGGVDEVIRAKRRVEKM